MKVPFCLPLIDEAVGQEMQDTLFNTGWLTTGPKVQAFTQELKTLTHAKAVLCVNSWNSGTTLMMHWWGIQPGDEVIIPAYTYSATAITVMNMGAIPVMVDVGEDFNITIENIRAAITTKTKIIMPVDIGGNPCDYRGIHQLLEEPAIQALFVPASEQQKQLGRILVISDAAHSIGATYHGKQSGELTDVSVFSFHSVKNITTGEGGAICLALPAPFDNEAIEQWLKYFSLYGQNKSALDKTKAGKWRYDIVEQGQKCNMTDIAASIGLSQIRRYQSELLPERKAIFQKYNAAFAAYPWAQLPFFDNADKNSSCHLYQLRIKNITEAQRDEIIEQISAAGVGLSVHYIPMAMLTLFKSKGYRIEDYPVTYDNYAREISLPIFNGLTEAQQDYVIEIVSKVCENAVSKALV